MLKCAPPILCTKVRVYDLGWLSDVGPDPTRYSLCPTSKNGIATPQSVFNGVQGVDDVGPPSPGLSEVGGRRYELRRKQCRRQLGRWEARRRLLPPRFPFYPHGLHPHCTRPPISSIKISVLLFRLALQIDLMLVVSYAYLQIPDELVEYYLGKSGFQCPDVRL